MYRNNFWRFLAEIWRNKKKSDHVMDACCWGLGLQEMFGFLLFLFPPLSRQPPPLPPQRAWFWSVSGPSWGVGSDRGGVVKRGFCKGKEYHWTRVCAHLHSFVRTRQISANPEKSDLVNFRGPDWRKFCVLPVFPGKTDKMLPKSRFSKPIFGQSAGSTTLDQPYCKRLWFCAHFRVRPRLHYCN